MTHEQPYFRATRPAVQGPRHRLGLPVWAIVGLAALAVPRILLHDLGVDVGPLGAAVLAIGPSVVWVLVVLRARVASPVVTLLAVGAVYGVALGVVHNLMWDEVFGDDPPTLNGVVDDDLAEIPLRIATFVSSLFTGIVVGLISGLAASGLRAVARSRAR
jgi:hypothetical protein